MSSTDGRTSASNERSTRHPSQDFSSSQQARHQDLTDQATRRHDSLTAAIEVLERALAQAGIHRETPWSRRAAKALAVVRETIHAHIEGVEERDGLFDEIEAVAPRLANRVAAFRREHESLSSRSKALAQRFEVDIDVIELRREAASLLADLRAHRAAEADLVYEAFWTELGAVD